MSLVRVMLGVDRLQPRIINSLLERLLEFSIDDAEETEAPVAAGDELALDISTMPRLILSQLRWLEKICRPESSFFINVSLNFISVVLHELSASPHQARSA
jgi:hypothetical protein